MHLTLVAACTCNLYERGKTSDLTWKVKINREIFYGIWFEKKKTQIFLNLYLKLNFLRNGTQPIDILLCYTLKRVINTEENPGSLFASFQVGTLVHGPH